MDIKCNLIIDSCCDLPYEVVDRDGVYLLKFPYLDDEGEHLDDLYRSRSAHDFTNRCAMALSLKLPKSLCPHFERRSNGLMSRENRRCI